jgi:hypothetical protein
MNIMSPGSPVLPAIVVSLISNPAAYLPDQSGVRQADGASTGLEPVIDPRILSLAKPSMA